MRGVRDVLDCKRGDRADRDECRADHHGGIHAIDERLAGSIAAVAGEHGGQNGHAEYTAKLTDRVVGSRSLPFLVGPNGGKHDIGNRGEEQRHPDARDQERPDELNVRDGRRRYGGDPCESDRLQRQPGSHQALATDAVGRRACEWRDENRHRRPWKDPQARLKRREALDGLEELSDEEDRAEHPEEHEQA